MWPDTYTDIGERFFGSDGSFHFEMWSLAPPSIGIQTLAFEICLVGRLTFEAAGRYLIHTPS